MPNQKHFQVWKNRPHFIMTINAPDSDRFYFIADIEMIRWGKLTHISPQFSLIFKFYMCSGNKLVKVDYNK